MKAKIRLIDFSEKDHDSIKMSNKMTPEQRISLLFELIELSNLFKPMTHRMAEKDDLPFVVLKKK